MLPMDSAGKIAPIHSQIHIERLLGKIDLVIAAIEIRPDPVPGRRSVKISEVIVSEAISHLAL